MNQQKVGGFLKQLRKEKQLTQEQLAEQLNVSGRTVSRWETGNNMPEISLLVEIAEFYDVSIPEIIDGERKSEKMKEESKEVAMSLSDYALKEKENLIKNIRIQSIFGVAALSVYFVIDTAGAAMPSYAWIGLLSNYCHTLIFVTPVMILLYTTGLLKTTENRRIQSTAPKSILILLAIVAATVVSCFIKFISSLLF